MYPSPEFFTTSITITLQGAGKVYGQYGDLNGCPQYGSEEFKNLVLDKIEGLTENYEKLKVENMELKDLILKIFSWKEKSTTTMEETKIRVQRVKSFLLSPAVGYFYDAESEIWACLGL